MKERGSTKEALFKIRRITAWLVLPAVISLLIAHHTIEDRFPTYFAVSGGSRAPGWMYTWRSFSGMLTLVLSVFSIPRWQAFIGIAGAIWVFFSLVPM
jgi:hypothetical protein